MKVDPAAPNRPAIHYHGAKWNLAAWIIRHLPPHEIYCEPYGGSAAVLLQKPRSLIEVYGDLDEEVVNFFEILRSREAELVRAIILTPFARAEWQQSFDHHSESLERARRFYVRSHMSIGGPTTQWSTGWRRQTVYSRGRNGNNSMTPAAISFMRTEHLYQVAQRLRGVFIENETAEDLIRRYDSPLTLFYIDPPYVFSARSKWASNAYRHEMSDEDHMSLKFTLSQIEGMAVVSGYRCDLYDYLYAHWVRIDRRARVNGPGSATESLWLSPKAATRLRHADLPLFGNTNGNGS